MTDATAIRPAAATFAAPVLEVDGARHGVRDGLTIGRSPDSDIVVAAPVASRRHAVVHGGPAGWRIEDLGTANGTWVNTDVLRSATRSLRHGDVVQIGGTRLAFVEPALDATAITIGRDATAQLVVDQPSVSRRHALLTGAGGRWVLRDLGSRNGTAVNGRRIAGPTPLAAGDRVRLGHVALLFDGAALRREDAAHQDARAGGPATLSATGLTVRTGERTLLDDVTLTLRPGRLCAIVGPSGAGKSTLLAALAGRIAPSSGAALVGGVPAAAQRGAVGLVPQEDVLHRDLTVRETLDDAARLRGGSAPEAAVHAVVERVIGELGLRGRADTRVRHLSGGERRRVNLGIELTADPYALLLDEPTTGLDPALEVKTMELLRSLVTPQRTVALVTHATRGLALCDELIVLAPGDRLAFHGPPADALRHFAVADFDALFAALPEAPAGPSHASAAAAPGPTPVCPPQPPAPEPGTQRRTLRVLLRRERRLLTRDRRNAALLLGQAPLLGLAAAGLFRAGIFGAPGRPVEAAQLLFVLVIVVLWLGAITGCRAFVKERGIAVRERTAGVPLGAYVAAKTLACAAVSVVQVLLLSAVVLSAHPLGEPGGAAPLVLVLLVCGLTAVLGGLAISAVAASQDQAVSLVPLLLVPQLLLGGAIVPLARMSGIVEALSRLAVSQWGFRGAGSAVQLDARMAAAGSRGGYDAAFFTPPVALVLLALSAFAAGALTLTVHALRHREARHGR